MFALSRWLDVGKPVGETILYFGCRHRSEDYIYEDELLRYKDEGLLTKLYVAFSRDQAHKVYVQHLLEQNGEEVWNILDKGGHIYVCGSVSILQQYNMIQYNKSTCNYLVESENEFVKLLFDNVADECHAIARLWLH